MKDYEKFFEDIPSDSLSAVIAVAMDMNASYNKLKVAKRIGYGYRDDDFFFALIRYLSIPSVRSKGGIKNV